MKKTLPLFLAATCFTPAAFAADISTLGTLAQSEFRILSEDLGKLSPSPSCPLNLWA
jgi:hypothetical protein